MKKNRTYAKQEKQLICKYLSKPEFRDRLQMIMDALISMKHELGREKKATERAWTNREKQIEDIASCMSMMCGEIDGISDTVCKNK